MRELPVKLIKNLKKIKLMKLMKKFNLSGIMIEQNF